MRPGHRGQARKVLSPRGRTWLALLSAALFLVLIDVFIQGPLVKLDLWVIQFDGQERFPALDQAAWIYDKAGQRSVLFPLLLVVAGVLSWRNRTWRPVCLAVFTFVSLNLVVGAMKILIGRSETETGSVDVFSGGVIFPSGHSSNMVLTGGLIIYLLRRYTERPRVRLLTIVVSVATALTCATSIYIGSHWVSDLIGGMLVGGLLLQAVIVFDRATVRARVLRERRIAGMVLEPGPVLRLGRFQGDRHRVDAVAVPRGRLGSVVEDVAEVRPAAAAPDLRAPHAE
jgi:membrane-associated phospholipid phosphatase